MRALVLLSGGIDPVSGRPTPPAGEIGAIGLAQRLVEQGGTLAGLHAGVPGAALRAAAGYGLDAVHVIGAGDDAVEVLARRLRDEAPDVVLTGRRGAGGEDSGMLPYLLAERLNWPLLGDVAAIGAPGVDGWLAVTIRLPLGAFRMARVQCPCILIAHDGCPAPPYAFDRARRAVITEVAPNNAAVGEARLVLGEDRPYRPRPKLIASSAAGAKGVVLVDPSPEAAARALVDHLRGLGLLPAENAASTTGAGEN